VVPAAAAGPREAAGDLDLACQAEEGGVEAHQPCQEEVGVAEVPPCQGEGVEAAPFQACQEGVVEEEWLLAVPQAWAVEEGWLPVDHHQPRAT
jgi:hypothetical protein